MPTLTCPLQVCLVTGHVRAHLDLSPTGVSCYRSCACPPWPVPYRCVLLQVMCVPTLACPLQVCFVTGHVRAHLGLSPTGVSCYRSCACPPWPVPYRCVLLQVMCVPTLACPLQVCFVTGHVRAHLGLSPTGVSCYRSCACPPWPVPYRCVLLQVMCVPTLTCPLQLCLVTGHVRAHLGLSPYKCDKCSYSSADKSTLVRHLRTHNGERPFQCLICEFAFTTKANCERHVR